MSVYVSESNVIVSDETVDSLRSQLKRLGAGVSRTVYDLGDGTVLKINHSDDGHFAGNNLSEWKNWQRIKGTEYEEHFAECIAVSEDGTWLIQRAIDRTLGDAAQYQEWSHWYNTVGKELSAEFGIGDLHYGNVGMTVQGNIVVIDYACTDENLDLSWLAKRNGICETCKSATLTPSPVHSCNELACAYSCRWTFCDICNAIDKHGFRNAAQPKRAEHYVLSIKVCNLHNVSRHAWSAGAHNRRLEENGQMKLSVLFVLF